ncbi:aminotransferase class-V family protein [Mycobacteroides abscessus]|nr:aminotransferase class-V family protein [Mycobacteroides abscessus]
MFEERLRLIEGAEAAFATATGMSAVFTALGALLGAGDRLVAARSLFGSCFVVCNEILPRWGVETVFVDGEDISQWEEALSVPTQAVFFETPSNPMQSLVDIEAVCTLAHASGAKVVLDNVFATPLLQQGIPLGADVVVYSGTKHIDGQGRVLGGAILGETEYIEGPVKTLMRHTGPALSPFNAWTLVKGLETLDLRVRHANDSAYKIAQFLEQHPAVRWVRLPVLGHASAVRAGQAADAWRRHRGDLRARRPTATRASNGPSGARRDVAHRHLDKPGRLQVAHHPPGYHHAPGHGAGGPGGDRAVRWRGAVVGWAGVHRRPHRGPGTGARLTRASFS